MADYENSEEVDASCEDLLQADLNLRTAGWTNSAEANEVQEEIVEEIVVEPSNENYLSCLDDDSIVYVFEEPVVEFELNDSPENMNCQDAEKGEAPLEEDMNSQDAEKSEDKETSQCESVINSEIDVNKCTVDSDNFNNENSSQGEKTLHKNSEDVNYENSDSLDNNENESNVDESSYENEDSDSNVLIGPLLPNQIPDYVPVDDFEQSLHQSPKVTTAGDTTETPPSLLATFNKNKLINESPLSQTKSDNSISPGLKPLGKEQIKKRLQSFSLLKQGIQPIPLKKIISPKQPKVHTTIEEVYDEIGRKTEEKLILKKPPKQGPTPSEKARQVINEIEQIKKEEQEIYEQTLLFMKHSMRDAHRRSKYYKKRDRDRSRSKSPSRRERKYDKDPPKRFRKVSEDDKFRRSLENDRRKSPEKEKKKIERSDSEDMPHTWAEMKRKNMDFVKIKRIKERIFKFTEDPIPPGRKKKKGKKKNAQNPNVEQEIRTTMKREDFNKPQLMFEVPSLLRTTVVALSVNGQSKYYPPELIRFTEKQPEISYCENPKNSTILFRNRKQVLSEVPEERAEIMLKIIENKLEPQKPGKFIEGVWYPHTEYLEESKNPIESVSSYGLSVLSEMYDDEQEEVQESTETKTEEKETKNKKKKSKKKHKKHKSRSSSEERTRKEKKEKKKRSKKKKKKEKSPEETPKPEEKKEEKDDSTPNTDEYRSNWESDEEFLNDIIPKEEKSFDRRNLDKWEIEESIQEDKNRNSSFMDKKSHNSAERKKISNFDESLHEERSSKRSNRSDDFEYSRIEERSFSRQSYEKREEKSLERSFSRQSYEKHEFEEKPSRNLDKDDFRGYEKPERRREFEEKPTRSVDKDDFRNYERGQKHEFEEKRTRNISKEEHRSYEKREEKSLERSFSRHERREQKHEFEERPSRSIDKEDFKRHEFEEKPTRSVDKEVFRSYEKQERRREYEEKPSRSIDKEDFRSYEKPDRRREFEEKPSRSIDKEEFRSYEKPDRRREFEEKPSRSIDKEVFRSYEKQERRREYEEKQSRNIDKEEFRGYEKQDRRREFEEKPSRSIDKEDFRSYEKSERRREFEEKTSRSIDKEEFRGYEKPERRHEFEEKPSRNVDKDEFRSYEKPERRREFEEKQLRSIDKEELRSYERREQKHEFEEKPSRSVDKEDFRSSRLNKSEERRHSESERKTSQDKKSIKIKSEEEKRHHSSERKKSGDFKEENRRSKHESEERIQKEEKHKIKEEIRKPEEKSRHSIEKDVKLERKSSKEKKHEVKEEKKTYHKWSSDEDLHKSYKHEKQEKRKSEDKHLENIELNLNLNKYRKSQWSSDEEYIKGKDKYEVLRQIERRRNYEEPIYKYESLLEGELMNLHRFIEKDHKRQDRKEDKKKNKKKSREKKKPKVQLNYTEDEESYDEDFKTAKQKRLVVENTENAKKYAAKIKIDYSDFDLSLSESKDKYNKKFEGSCNPSPEKVEKSLDTPLTPKERKVNIDLSEIILEHPIIKNEEPEKQSEINLEETPEQISEMETIVIESPKSPEIVEISDSPVDTPEKNPEFHSPKTRKIEVEGITPITPKSNSLTSITPLEISPVAAPVLPIPTPVDLPTTPVQDSAKLLPIPSPVVQDPSKLVSEYEEFMKAVSFDEPNVSEVEIPESKKDSESSESSEYDSSEPSDSSSDAESTDSETRQSKMLERIANIKTEKVTDSESESQDAKRKRDKEICEVVVKTEKEAKKIKMDPTFESETKYNNVIDWEKTDNYRTKSNFGIIDVCNLPSILPENIPLPNETIVENIPEPDIPTQEESPKEIISISSDSSTPSPVKKARSIIPIKLLTAESRKQANETAKLIPAADHSPGFGVFAQKDILPQESTDNIPETNETMDENSRKRQSQWNINITPAKKPLLQTNALADDSDEDFTDKFIKPDKKLEQQQPKKDEKEKEEPEKEKLEVKEPEKLEPPVVEKKLEPKPKEEAKKQEKQEKPKHHSPERHKDDHRRRSPPKDTRAPRRSDRYDRREKSPERKRSRDRSTRDPRESRDTRERDRERESLRDREMREREKRRLSDRRPDRKPVPPRGRSPRSRYSRERELQRVRPRDRSRERPRPPERDRSRERGSRERIRERSRDREHRERVERYRRDERRFSRSVSPRKDFREELPIPRPDDTDFSTTSMDIVQSPVNSPLDGFKRSLADSTISDSELITQVNTPDESNEPSPAYPPYYPTLETGPENRDSPSSPKRISLDDRINLVLGIEKEPPKQIDTVCTRGSYSHPPPNYDPYGYNRSEYDVYNTHPPPDGYVPPYQYQNQYYPPPTTDNNVKVVQVGNVIQVVPTEHPPPVQAPVPKPEQPKVVQVGNMLQIVPVTIIETNTVTTVTSPVATVATPVEKPVVVSPPKMTEQIAAERRAEKEKRRLEREARRKEKERKRKEKEKRKQLKIKTKTENMIKRALMLETGEGELDISNIDTEPTPETSDNNNLPVAWPPASALTSVPLPKPPSKGILVTHGFREKDESFEDSETRKVVKFADGICPGEGTSPSAGEDLPSPPPPPRKLPKEKRYKKVKNKNKKKIKVKIIRTQQQPADDDSSSEDNLPPPPPPPGSPPPHLWPPRIKQPPVNNIHPQVLSFPTPPPQVLYPPAFPPLGPMGHAPPPPPARQHHPPVMPVLQTGPPPPPPHHGAHQTSFHH